MSRVTRRAGTKALVCQHCVRQTVKHDGRTPRNVGSFRGKGRGRLARHILEVHLKPRVIRPRSQEVE